MAEAERTKNVQQPVTAIPSLVARVAAIVLPVLALAAVMRSDATAQSVILWGATTLILVGVAALLAYILTTGQFPPKLGKQGDELPPEDVEDAGASLDLIQQTVVELAERVERVERVIGLEQEERDVT